MYWHTSTPASTQTKPVSCFVFPSPKPSRRCISASGWAGCEGGSGGGKGAKKACTANSAHERVMQPEQLPAIVSLQISACLIFATPYMRRKRGEGEQSGNAAERDGRGGGEDIRIALSHQVSVGSVLFLLFRAVVGVLLDLGLIINPEAVQTSITVHTHTHKECSAAIRGGREEGD